MEIKDFEVYRRIYWKDCKTKSNNPSVLKLYSFILDNENRDSDFWKDTVGDGFREIHYILNDFNKNDWENLTDDIFNWTIFQKEIFTEGLLWDDLEKKSFSEEEIKNIESRFEIIPILLKMKDSYSQEFDNLSSFIVTYLPRIDLNNLKVAESIIEIKNWNERICFKANNGAITTNAYTEAINNAYLSLLLTTAKNH